MFQAASAINPVAILVAAAASFLLGGIWFAGLFSRPYAIALLKIDALPAAAAFSALVGVGYLASTTVNTAIPPNMPRPLVHGLVSGGYFFMSGIVGSMILVLLK